MAHYLSLMGLLAVSSCERNSSSAQRDSQAIESSKSLSEAFAKTDSESIEFDKSSHAHPRDSNLDQLNLAIHEFFLESNLARRDYVQYTKWIVELAEKYPDEACKLLASGSISEAYQGKVSMFSAMLENDDPSSIIPLLEELAKARNKNPDGHETAQALSEALGKVGSDSKFANVLKLLFSGDDARSNISYYFKEAGLLRGVGLADHLDEFGLSAFGKNDAIFSIALSIAGKSPDDAVKLLDGLDSRFAGSAYGELMSQLLENDPTRARRLFLELDSTKLQGALKHPYLMQALAKSENSDLLESALQRISLTNDSSQTFGTLVKQMSVTDRSKSSLVLDQLPESSLRSDLIKNLWFDANINSFEEAVRAVSELPAASTADGTRGIVMRLAESNPKAAFQLIAQSPSTMQSQLTADVIQRQVSSSPGNAALLLEQETASGRLDAEDASNVANHISLSYANHDISEARLWAENLPQKLQPGAFKGLMESWGRSDPAGASQWLATIPAGPSRDAGARALVKEIESTDAQMAAKWKQTYQK